LPRREPSGHAGLSAALGLFERCLEGLRLVGTTDEASKAPSARNIQTRAQRSQANEIEDPHRIVDTFDLECMRSMPLSSNS